MAAEKRMMAISLIDDDAFLDLPQGAQVLYFHLVMRADDEGFLTPKKIMRAVGASKSSLSALVNAGFVIEFDTGVICIKHWLSHNSVRKDCFTPSVYPERALVEAVTVSGRKEYRLIERNGIVTERASDSNEDCNEGVTASLRNRDIGEEKAVQNHIDGDKETLPKERIGKGKKELSLSKESSSKKESPNHVTEPLRESIPKSLDEVIRYFSANCLKGNPERFYYTYRSKGWVDGAGIPVRDWRAKAQLWSSNENTKPSGSFFGASGGGSNQPRDYDGSYDSHSMKEATL